MIPVLASVVGGGRREGDTVAADVNPAAPEEHVATVSLAGPGIAADAIEAAASAFAAWRETPPPPPRGDVLRRAADLVDARADTTPSSRPRTRVASSSRRRSRSRSRWAPR